MWFFMSYAHEDSEVRDSGFAQQFFDDLSKHVSGATGTPASECGYLDKANLRPGDPWKDELADAVRQSKTFISLMNLRYFDREYCGKEWTLFEDRCKSYEQAHGELPRLIIPVMWEEPLDRPFPEFATDLQYGISLQGVLDVDKPYIEDLNKRGVVYVIRRRKNTHSNAYLACIEGLAKEIVQRAGQFPLPEMPKANLPALDQIQAKFPADNSPAAPANSPHSASSQAGFAVVAGTHQELQPVLGNDAVHYGEGGDHWIPFHPSGTNKFFVIAMGQALDKRLRYEWVEVNNDLVDKVKEAEKQNRIMIMVVDPVTASLPQYAQILKDFDQYMFRNCVVLVPWSDSIPDAANTRQALEDALRGRFATANACYLRDGIVSVEDLENEIAAAIKDLTEILASQRPPQRPIDDGPFNSPPTLTSV